MQNLQCVESAQWPVTTLSNPATPAAGAKAQGRPANRVHRCWSGGAARPWATPQLVSSGRAQGLCASQLETLSTDEAALPPPISPTLQQAPRPLGRGPIAARPVKPTWVSAPLIMRKIKDTDSLQAMRQVLEEHQQQFNHIHISAAVLQFAKLVTGVAHSTKNRLPTSPSPSPTPTRSPSPATQNGSSLQATAQLELGSPSPPLQRSETSPQPDAPDLLRQLLGMVVSELDSFDLRGISNTIYSLALLKHNDGIMVESLLRAAQYRLDTGTPQNLSNIIWATVTLGHTPEREWMALYYNAIDMQIQQFQAQDISNMLWAFGRLQFAGTQYKVAPDIVRQLLQQAYPQLADFSPQELSNSVWGLARLGFAPNPAWCQAFLAVSQYRLPAMHPKEVVSLVWAVSRLRMRPGDVWLNAAIQATSPWLTTLSNHQLSQLMVSFGSLGARPAAAWLSKALSCALSKVRHHTPMSLSTMVTGVAMLGGPMQAGLSMAQAEAWLEDHLSLAWEMMGGTDASSTATSNSHASIHHNTTTAAMHREHGLELDPQQRHPEQPQIARSGNRQYEGSHHVNGSSISNLSPTQRSGGAVLIQGSDTVLAASQDLLQSSDRVLVPLLPQDPGQSLQGIMVQEQAPSSESQPQQAAHPAAAASQQVAVAATQPDDQEQDSFLAMLDSADSDALQPAMMVCEAGLLLEEDDELQEPVYVWHPQCQFTAPEFGHLLYALVTLGVRLRPPQLSHVCRTLERAPGLLESVASQGKTLGLVLWSIVCLIKLGSGGSSGGGEHAQLQRDLPQQRVLDGRIPVLPASLMARLAVVTRLLMQRRYSAAELALLLRVMAAQPAPPPERWMAAFWWRSVVLLGKRQVQPAVLASQLTSLVALGYQPHGTWWRGALQCMQTGFGDFKAEHFGAVLRRMAQLGYVPNAAWSQQCLLAMYHVWDQMMPEHWEQTFWALAKLKISVPSSWMLRYYQTSYTQLQHYTPRQLACIGWAVARLGTMPPAPWAWAYQNASATRLSQLTPAELIWCAYGVAHCVRHPMRRWVGRAVTVVRSKSALGSLGPEQEQMLAIALQRILHRYRAGVVTASRRATAASSSAENSAGVGSGAEVIGTHQKPMHSYDEVNPAEAWPHAGALVALPTTDSDKASPSSRSPRTAQPSATATCHLDTSSSNNQEQLASSPTNAASTVHPGAVSADEVDAANRCHSAETASVARSTGSTNGRQSERQLSEAVEPVQLQSGMQSSDAATPAGFDYPAPQDRPLAATTTSSRSAAVRSRVAVAVMAMSGAVLDSALPGQPGPTGRGAGRTSL